MEDCNGLPTPTKVEAPLGTDVNGTESKIDWPNSYASVIGMMLYLASNTRPDISTELRPGSQTTYRTRPSKHSLSFGPPTNAADQADADSPPTS